MMKFIPLLVLGLLFSGCAHTTVSQADTNVEKELKSFIRGLVDDFNSQVPGAYASKFHFPHTRLKPKAIWFDDPSVPSVDYKKLKATGWDHSILNELEVLYSTSNQGIVRLNFSRLTKEGKIILTTDAIYTLTKIDGQWGIACMFSAANNLPLE
jgi:hypothetical protein